MTKDDFAQFVADYIKNYLPEEYMDAKIVIEEVFKFNEKYLGLTLRRDKTEAVPCLNLDMYYEMHERGEDLEDILIAMAEIIKIPPKSIDFSILADYEKAKEHLVLRVCNASRNQEYLESIAHTVIADMAITYGIAIGDDTHGYQIATMKKTMLDEFGVSVSKLHKDALESSLKKFPPLLFNMADMIALPQRPKNLLEEDKTVENKPNIPPFYVLTNLESFEGASALFYPEILDKAAKVIGEDYVIIPSSIHEVLLIPDSAGHSLGDLKGMIQSANDYSGTVSNNEILGYEPYHYDSKDKIFETAESFAKRTAKKEKLDVRIASAEEKLTDAAKPNKEREAINGERENEAL